MGGQSRTAKQQGGCVVKKHHRANTEDTGLSRRDFVRAATAAAAFTIVPRYVLGGAGNVPPSEKLNIAGIGIGGRGAGDLHEVSSENIVALCDVDQRYAAGVFKSYPSAKRSWSCRKIC